MLPDPRITAANALHSQMLMDPANTTCAYAKHCSSASPWPPSALKMDVLKRAKTKVKNKPIPTLMSAACSTKALALSGLLAPKARLMAEEIPPPTEPADNICCSITNGKTKAIPAKGMMPNWPTYQVSAKLTKAAAVMAKLLGSVKRQIVGTMGALMRSCCKRLLCSVVCEVGRALVQKRVHAFFLIVCGKH